MAVKPRLDIYLVELGLIETREKAKRAVMAGQVLVNNIPATKASQGIPEGAVVTLKARDKYVGRGGLKLEAALSHFNVKPEGLICLDVGASTGGFTDCLLQHGAQLVYAVDVGQGQLAWKLRNDPRVIIREKVNARELQLSHFSPPPAFVCIDVSFISLTKIIPVVYKLLPLNGQLVALIKPQFEAGKAVVDKGAGVVRDPSVHAQVVEQITQHCQDNGFRAQGVIPSPLLGAEGNKEFLIYAIKSD
ncbi:MAG: TlyA family RNA methyltransferase [Verrucomicrobiota bacterium]|nr:TlyA family RNA methyltransferase [Verrucomicrobiota bacterium]